VREDGRTAGGKGRQGKVRDRNGKESLHSAHANGMSEYFDISNYG